MRITLRFLTTALVGLAFGQGAADAVEQPELIGALETEKLRRVLHL